MTNRSTCSAAIRPAPQRVVGPVAGAAEDHGERHCVPIRVTRSPTSPSPTATSAATPASLWAKSTTTVVSPRRYRSSRP